MAFWSELFCHVIPYDILLRRHIGNKTYEITMVESIRCHMLIYLLIFLIIVGASAFKPFKLNIKILPSKFIKRTEFYIGLIDATGFPFHYTFHHSFIISSLIIIHA